jgi:hypothetical protein
VEIKKINKKLIENAILKPAPSEKNSIEINPNTTSIKM